MKVWADAWRAYAFELEARAERLAAALRKIERQADDSNWGPGTMCDEAVVLKIARAALADAPEPRPCPKCERLTAQIHRSVGALNEALSGVMSGILKISDDAHDQIGEPIADLVDALVDVPNAGQEQTSEEKQAEASRGPSGIAAAHH
jgi:hypothetical protein